ncbi:MAG: hypothetical protein ABFD25_11225 [Clostridiaceae bacterium]
MCNSVVTQTVGIIAGELSKAASKHMALILKERIEARCPAVVIEGEGDINIHLSVCAGFGEEGFRIEDGNNGCISITGNDCLGLLYGIGKFLHTSLYGCGGVTPSTWRGTSIPQGKVRGMYFASHFFNWYHVATESELSCYMEDLALWGVNSIMLVFPIINLFSWDDAETENSFNQMKKIYRSAKVLGLKTGLIVVPNQDFRKAREDIKAVPNIDPSGRKGNNGNNICPNAPGAKEYIIKNMEEVFSHMKDVAPDYLCLWPYDEGGCGCDRCYPWGANGYLSISEAIAAIAHKFFPNIRVILSTWVFDNPPEGEWEGLSKALAGKESWVDYILADSHEDFPSYPLNNPVPGRLPLLNFPEISMWGLSPWGGYGATPLPGRFERLWKQVRHIVKGGFPYSEGIYEDINKVVISRFYWDAGTTAEESLKDYISYEFSKDVMDDVIKMVELIEKNHLKVVDGNRADIDDADLAFEIAERVNGKLPEFAKKAWRWRILYIRTLLDRERYKAVKEDEWPWPSCKSWGVMLEGNRLAEDAMKELVTIYHAKSVDDGTCPQHAWIRPPLKA